MSQIIFKLPSILDGQQEGWNWLCDVAASCMIDTAPGDEVVFDFEACGYIEGNLCAVLGSIIHGIQMRKCDVQARGIKPGIRETLYATHFLRYFIPALGGGEADNDPDVVPFRYFAPHEEVVFRNYIAQDVFQRLNMLNLSRALRKEMQLSIGEIYVNAITHGASERVFCCGQVFAFGTERLLHMTIVDLGDTIKNKVIDFLKQPEWSAVRCIEWATSEQNTTKQGNHSGGLGLKVTKEFIRLNKGFMHIVSDSGFWRWDAGQVTHTNLAAAFPGTIVTLGFNLNDVQHYLLTTEVPNLNNPF